MVFAIVLRQPMPDWLCAGCPASVGSSLCAVHVAVVWPVVATQLRCWGGISWSCSCCAVVRWFCGGLFVPLMLEQVTNLEVCTVVQLGSLHCTVGCIMKNLGVSGVTILVFSNGYIFAGCQRHVCDLC